MSLIGAHSIHMTPRQWLAEVEEMIPHGEQWRRKRYAKIRAFLEKETFHGRPVLDEPMSMSNFDALMKEAWARVKDEPDPLEQMMRDMHDKALQ